MRGAILIGAGLAAILTAGIAREAAQRTMVVERARLGEPPRPAPKAEDLVGSQAPAFTADDLNGKRVGIPESRGRVVVVSIWATWCPPCVEELPRVEREIWQRFRSDVTVIAVARGERRDRVLAFNERAKLTFSLVPDPGARITSGFGPGVIPRTYVVGRSGRIVYQEIGYNASAFPRLVAAVERAVASR